MKEESASKYAKVSVEIADQFADVGEEARDHFRNGTVPRYAPFGAERLYWLWHLWKSAGAMYKTNYHLKGIIDRAPENCVNSIIGAVHHELGGMFDRNLLRVMGELDELIKADHDFVVGLLTVNSRNSAINQAINDHPVYLRDVLAKGNSHLKTSEGMVALLGYSAGLAKGIREFADRAFDQMFPDKLNQGVFDYLDTTGFDGLFFNLVEEINGTYPFGFYVSTAFLSRKLLESLLIGILQRKYAGTADDELYQKPDGRYQGFYSMAESFWDRFDNDFKSYSNLTNETLLDEMKDRIDVLRKRFNANVHQPGSFPSKSFLDGYRNDLVAVVTFLNHIYTNLAT